MASIQSTTIYGNYATSNWRSYFTYSTQETDNQVIVIIESAGINCEGGWTDFTSTNAFEITLDGSTEYSATKTISGKIPQHSSKACVSNVQITVPKTGTQQTVVITNVHTHNATSTATVTIQISAGFELPTVNGVTAYRSDASKNVQNNSTRVCVKATISGGNYWTFVSSTATVTPQSSPQFTISLSKSGSTLSGLASTSYPVPTNETASVVIRTVVKDLFNVNHTITSNTYLSTENYTVDFTPNSIGFGVIARDNPTNFAVDFGDANRTVDVTINNKPIADFVYEQGTSGDWKYRKWASGKYELWGHFENANQSAIGYGSVGYYSMGGAKTYPFAFSSRPYEIANAVLPEFSTSGLGVWVSTHKANTTTQSCEYYINRPQSNSNQHTVGLDIYVCGNI